MVGRAEGQTHRLRCLILEGNGLLEVNEGKVGLRVWQPAEKGWVKEYLPDVVMHTSPILAHSNQDCIIIFVVFHPVDGKQKMKNFLRLLDSLRKKTAGKKIQNGVQKKSDKYC